ncbi:molecular chaperone GrpE [Granulicatella balaenopterae]|uniref:Protein GrpE n=1 Tax=Granulicatella balaenopterae TaxID=137733 RepID=A0A1H9L4S1_9LACT|nr:nucleotide exchange factor GrpE [Granulicatella balaenopterae]SER06396.1 molecular chaperone GrpE [Granulicatella balaenopterae]
MENHEEKVEDLTNESTESEAVETEEVVTEETVLTKEQELEQQVAELNDKVYRLSAEISNIQKRNAKERQDAAKYRSQSLAQNLLSVLDNIERALQIEVEGEQAEGLKKGIEMVYEGFQHALNEEGIEVIDALNQPFDPTKHHAVQAIPAEEGQEADMVVQEFQKGYILKDRVLRPAMVIVSQ